MTRTRAVAAALVIALAISMSEPATAGGSTAPIYRIKVLIETTSTLARLSLDGPALLIEGRANLLTDYPRARASFGQLGEGPLRIRQPSVGRRFVEASFVVALTPSGVSPLRFQSRKGGSGRSTITMWNLNEDDPDRIRRVAHLRSHGRTRRFSVDTSAVSARGGVPGTAPLDPLVLAFYYPWYRLDDWEGDRPIAGYNRNPDPYRSDDAVAVARHLSQGQEAGIDGFISSWWGRDTYTDRNFALLLDLAPVGFTSAIYLETFSGNFQTKGDLVAQIAYVLETYGSRPGYLKYEGKPVVYAFATDHVLRRAGQPPNPDYRAVWEDVLRRIREVRGLDLAFIGQGTAAANLGVFDGLHQYATTDPRTTRWIDIRTELIARAYAAVHGGSRRVWGASVIPGYDDRHIPGRESPRYFPRDDGALYRDQWQAAIDSRSDQVLVVSFNEWPETTNIEPNEKWGGKYLRLTGDHAAEFRASR